MRLMIMAVLFFSWFSSPSASGLGWVHIQRFAWHSDSWFWLIDIAFQSISLIIHTFHAIYLLSGCVIVFHPSY